MYSSFYYNVVPGEFNIKCLFSFPGDIAFRFLDYVRNQSGDVDGKSGGRRGKDEGDLGAPLFPTSSHVTVCDINQAMLDVGKAKSVDRGNTTGTNESSF